MPGGLDFSKLPSVEAALSGYSHREEPPREARARQVGQAVQEVLDRDGAAAANELLAGLARELGLILEPKPVGEIDEFRRQLVGMTGRIVRDATAAHGELEKVLEDVKTAGSDYPMLGDGPTGLAINVIQHMQLIASKSTRTRAPRPAPAPDSTPEREPLDEQTVEAKVEAVATGAAVAANPQQKPGRPR